MLNLDPELIRQLHREREGRLIPPPRPERDPEREQRRPARPAPRLRIALRLRRPRIQLREDL